MRKLKRTELALIIGLGLMLCLALMLSGCPQKAEEAPVGAGPLVTRFRGVQVDHDLDVIAGDLTVRAGALDVTVGATTLEALEVGGTSNLDEVDIDGVTNLIVGTEHIGVPSIISTAITYTAAAGGTGAVATIGDGEIWLVWSVFVSVTTDFDCTGDDTTLVIGDDLDPNGFVDLADAELQAADTEYTGATAGWQGLVAATMGIYLDGAVSSAPHIYSPSGAAQTIDWLLDETTGETITAGAATIYVVYTRIS